MKLLIEALTKFACGLLLVGLLIFLPAGTLRFFGGWLLMGVLFVPMFCTGLVMLAKAPALLEKRLQAKEKHSNLSGREPSIEEIAGELGINRQDVAVLQKIILIKL